MPTRDVSSPDSYRDGLEHYFGEQGALVRPDSYRYQSSLNNMASVYILYSPSLNIYYTGSCQKISERIQQHLNGAIPGAFTAKTKDWVLYFSIDDLNYEQARLIEFHIKRMKSKVYIENLKKYPELSRSLEISTRIKNSYP